MDSLRKLLGKVATKVDNNITTPILDTLSMAGYATGLTHNPVNKNPPLTRPPVPYNPNTAPMLNFRQPVQGDLYTPNAQAPYFDPSPNDNPYPMSYALRYDPNTIPSPEPYLPKSYNIPTIKIRGQ